eukprot:TRINITY_DN30838_c0_g1_i1.p1 TRINITY_DN30838_c0_g1~~TRINITY_DN30838_c0_g1_i1.p1  ORF type:complete len:199 (+),score=33.24 TRINITY_DN30838_c0_g1_i1:113-709(+)
MEAMKNDLLHLVVALLSGEDAELVFKPYATFRELRVAVAQALGVPRGSQALLLNGELLQCSEDMDLASMGLGDGDRLTALFRRSFLGCWRSCGSGGRSSGGRLHIEIREEDGEYTVFNHEDGREVEAHLDEEGATLSFEVETFLPWLRSYRNETHVTVKLPVDCRVMVGKRCVNECNSPIVFKRFDAALLQEEQMMRS